jgi:hypothetical protein
LADISGRVDGLKVCKAQIIFGRPGRRAIGSNDGLNENIKSDGSHLHYNTISLYKFLGNKRTISGKVQSDRA